MTDYADTPPFPADGDTATSTDDYDTPWKDALTRHFPEFIAFYFPDAARQIDWARGHAFLDQELAQVVRDAELGRRRIDKLARVALHDGGERWVYVHVEVQGGYEHEFAERLFTYNYRLYDRYRRPVATLAVLADEREHWLPRGFGYELFGCRHYLEFPAVKLLDHADRLDALLADPNPFALVTAAHLLTRQTRGNDQLRLVAKWRLARLLYQRDWDRQRIIDLFAVIDWMMQIPMELQQRLWQDIQRLERRLDMPYMTSIERIGLEKGMEKGLRQGLKQGLEQGLEQGLKRGEAAVLERLLVRRFGALTGETRVRLENATLDQLERWTDNILDARRIEDVFDEA